MTCKAGGQTWKRGSEHRVFNGSRKRRVPLLHIKRDLKKIAAKAYAQVCHSPHWRVGYRRVGDDDLWTTQSLAGTSWRTLPDPQVRFLTDPIAIEHGGRTVLFVEDFDHRLGKGSISAIEFSETGPLGPPQSVLEENWHLSYPFVFAADGEVWMIPESSANRDIALYRAASFPGRWIREATLIPDIAAVDATIFWRGESYWLLTTVHNGRDDYTDLHVFHAPRLLGPWRAHTGNPVLRDPRTARSAGPVVEKDGKLWRPVQDCGERYGAAVGLAEITRIDQHGYEQRVRAVVGPCREWPGRRLHTLSQAGGFEFIDGSANVLRWGTR